MELETTLTERLELLDCVKAAFLELFPERPQRIRRGEAQEAILARLDACPDGHNRRAVTEALRALGYAGVKIQGTLFYRREKSEAEK